MYNQYEQFCPLYSSDKDYFGIDDFDKHACIAPTISQVLKWLREEKKIHIKVDLYYDGWDTLIYTDLHTDDIGEYKYNCIDRGDLSRSTYEKTVLDSIEYIIDNLI